VGDVARADFGKPWLYLAVWDSTPKIRDAGLFGLDYSGCVAVIYRRR